MKKFLKIWGGWILWGVTLIFYAAVFVADKQTQAEDIKEIKQTLVEINEALIEQANLNGRIIQYMEMAK
jgi:hypothetical protein